MDAATSSNGTPAESLNEPPKTQQGKLKKSAYDTIFNDEDEEEDDDEEWEYEYDENETEDFYITLDLTTHSGTVKRAGPSLNSSSFSSNHIQKNDTVAEHKENSNEGRSAASSVPPAGQSEGQAATPPNEREKLLKKEIPIKFQNLASDNPLIVYKNKLYSCDWASAIGTDLFITPSAAENDDSSGNKTKLLYKSQEFSVVGTTPVRLVGKPAHAEAISNGEVQQQASSSAAPKSPRITGTTGKEFDNIYKKRQAEFLTRFAALKKVRGEADELPWWTNQPVNRRSSGSTKRASRQKRKQRSLYFDEEEEEEDEDKVERRGDGKSKKRKVSSWNAGHEEGAGHSSSTNGNDAEGSAHMGSDGAGSDTSGGLDTYWDDPEELKEKERENEGDYVARTTERGGNSAMTSSRRRSSSTRRANAGVRGRGRGERAAYEKKRGRPLSTTLSLTGPSEETSRKTGNTNAPAPGKKSKGKGPVEQTEQKLTPAKKRGRPVGRPRGPGKNKMPDRAGASESVEGASSAAAAEVETAPAPGPMTLVAGDTEEVRAAKGENIGSVPQTPKSQATPLNGNERQAGNHAEKDQGAAAGKEEERVVVEEEEGMVTRRRSRMMQTRPNS